MAAFTVIDHTELSGTTASWDVTSIPATYDHLYAVVSARTDKATGNYEQAIVSFNGATTNQSGTSMSAYTGTPTSGYSASNMNFSYFPTAGQLADTFGAWSMWIPNYANTANFKQALIKFSVENNSAADYEWMEGIVAGLWSSTAAVNQITLTPMTDEWIQYSTFTLYGVTGA
jgi:hypothetical protein